MKLLSNKYVALFGAAGAILCSISAHAAIALDRTRIVMDAENHSVSLTIANESRQQPYLAQGWIENERGEKVNSPLTVLPPVQRLEAGEKSQIKIQSLSAVNLLSQDKETLFYFNLREIPPRSDQANTLQIALQTRIKLFYRPAALRIASSQSATAVQQQITLVREGDKYRVLNPTGYYITLIDARRSQTGEAIQGFEPVMVAPRDRATLTVGAAALGDMPVLEYVNDYGGRSALTFRCHGMTCKATTL